MLWDVLASCEIKGSGDSSIKNPVYNDVASFVKNKSIVKILCNGKKTHELCLKINLTVPVIGLPSTSPANAAWNMERLTAAWSAELK